ncbi:MAG: hypothetical protein ACRDN0_24835 [Trebonia sp.]
MAEDHVTRLTGQFDHAQGTPSTTVSLSHERGDAVGRRRLPLRVRLQFDGAPRQIITRRLGRRV